MNENEKNDHSAGLAAVGNDTGSSTTETASDVLNVALATIRRLNRRCQTAEAALNMRVEQFEQRSKGAVRGHYFDRGREYERCRLFAPPTSLERAANVVVALLLESAGVPVGSHGKSLVSEASGPAQSEAQKTSPSNHLPSPPKAEDRTHEG